MQRIELTYPLSSPVPGMPGADQVMAIGDFDGVHLGHREVIRRAVETARRLRLPASIMTFHPHPREVLGQDMYARYITPPGEKLARFAELGVDVTYVVTFDKAFSQLSPQRFVTEMLFPLRVGTVVVGFDFTFGHKGEGDPDTLCELSGGRFAVEVVRPFYLDGVKVSSTLIRDRLGAGDVRGVARLLGRRYTVTGQVVHGDARGRQIGFPTANVEPDEPYVIPANGVYAVKATVDGIVYAAVMNIGTKPTFSGDAPRRTLEAHLFDFSGSLYGKTITLEFLSFLRQERKFGSVDELVAQIRQDVEQAKQIHLHYT